MAGGFTSYEWNVTLVHETQGFAKKFQPLAINYLGAVDAAFRELHAKGYEPGEFIVIELQRRKGVA